MTLTAETKKYIKWTLNLFILASCTLLVLKKIDIEEVINQTKSVNLLIFAITVPLSILRTWLSGMRWEALHPDKMTKLTRMTYFRLSMIAHVFNKFMPGALGGDIVKTLYTFKEKGSQKTKNVIAVFVDRTVGLISIMIFGFIALSFTGHKLDIKTSQMVLLFLGSGGFLIVLASERVLKVIEQSISKIGLFVKPLTKLVISWKESVIYYKNNKGKILYSLALCIPIHFLSFLSFFIFSQSIGMSIGFLELVFVIAIMWLITALPISVGGVGVRELTLVWLLGMFGVPSEQAVSLSIMGYINNTFLTFVALPFLIDIRKNKIPLNESSIDK